ncbi:hypothetical protein JCM16774_1109 [Pseudoleptotrichia goodfellowii]|uniref:Uncharacterized protein n=1 Tax=Pseudoleptotrichia goodfellowii TaxID=157692 RepID=A0A510JAF7_9FUSO|nr:hypothetical protein [Pseudoleptotrichia goodfellowii]BBM36177.1 hypothetical protein JCM16774_1109 [Pseudoleptotrichia goodfellowii]
MNKNKEILDSFLKYASDILADTESKLTGEKIKKKMTEYSGEFDVEISIDDKFPNKRSLLFDNLKKFSAEQQFYILTELCEAPEIKEKTEILELKKKIYNRYGELSINKASSELLIIETEEKLRKYEESHKKYKLGIEYFEKNEDKRHILDDMRLSLELLLKEILGNEKSLENQKSELGKRLKEKGISPEIMNMFEKVLNYYFDYQNNNVKHNDKINDLEVKYIMEQTSIMIKFIIQTLGE